MGKVIRTGTLDHERSDKLEFTGERFTPECVREIWYEHMHRYVLAGEFVLDAACGEGFGARYLSERARSVAALDNSERTIAHASARYRRANLSFQVGDCRELPFADGEFDCIVSFETLEHVREQEQMLAEFRRVLSGEGFLLISSPDKAIYSDRLKNENPFHVRELYRQELEELLAREFPAVRLMGHKLAFHSMIWPLDLPPDGKAEETGCRLSVSLNRDEDGAAKPLAGPGGDAVYFIALCAADRQFLPQIAQRLWLFDDAGETVYRHYHHEIRKNMQAGKILQNKDREIEALRAELQDMRQRARRPWWRRLFGGT